MHNRPEANEYNSYYSTYVNLIPEGNIVHILEGQIKETAALLKDLTEEQASFCYAPGKWSVKEVIGHMSDTERIMAYRLLSVARGEKVSLPGYDENEYVLQASFNRLSLKEIFKELEIVRQSTISLLNSLSKEAWLRWGTANQSEVTVRGLASIIAGHELHHRQIIRERYIGSDSFPVK